ncbi:MAG: DUF4124 domain-containing protein [Ramlibacter sp.]|nr:DUF4124 domain-containing protein [Ramlibacter sp.]
MRLLRVISLAAALLPALACAQWQWIDKDGRKVFSDRSPPPDIPAKSILKQPGGKSAPPPPAEAQEPGAAPSGPAVVAKAAASGPRIGGTDKTLGDKKKQVEQEELGKKKAEEDKVSHARADNCDRSKRSLSALNSGTRIRMPNAKGELEVISDAQRAAETKRLQGLTADCKT